MKKNMKQGLLWVCLLAILGTSACKKDNNPSNNTGSATVNMRLTDGPSAYDHVYLDIQQVAVTMESGSAVTLTPVRAGIYDIMQFRNGLDTLLVRATLPAGTIQQIRLILGNNNSVVVNGDTYALSTPSAQESGVKLNLHQTFVADGVYDIWLDFDAGKSIVTTGNGGYKLKPVIRAYSAATNGRIKGYVLPLNALATVYAINGTDTLSAIPDATDGFFVISGMAEGSYTLWVDPGIVGLQAYTQANIQVNYSTEVNVGTITLVP
ncbi:MAG: hypothetical protein BGO69_03890 [Bacteroidetes bacterium 46-16]|nr:MAG: hypothetical protein BGO69_03890 [Bacteroidetes bacterium 46-16]